MLHYIFTTRFSLRLHRAFTYSKTSRTLTLALRFSDFLFFPFIPFVTPLFEPLCDLLASNNSGLLGPRDCNFKSHKSWKSAICTSCWSLTKGSFRSVTKLQTRLAKISIQFFSTRCAPFSLYIIWIIITIVSEIIWILSLTYINKMWNKFKGVKTPSKQSWLPNI